jgi:pSer/pThr/pTyr-binding forkhead associated (FHA) protein
MSLLELGGRRFPIPVGEVTLGSDARCAIALSGAGILPTHLLLDGRPDGQVVVRKASPAAEALINGVRLGAEPTPLLHGDKLTVAGHELTFVDERRAGSTQFVKAFAAEAPAPGAPAVPRAAGGAIGTTGGRVVSLTDGREYAIGDGPLVLGRDAECDVVVPGTDVSRRHAEIVPTPAGYRVVDRSTNGTFVNGERVAGQRLLARGDVIRIGDEQFRFYADVTPAAAPARAAGAALASLLVRSGGLKGRRLVVRTPLANIGRADYNDLVLPDPSVSTAHAKLQRREGVWVLVDLDSTNGTFVDGERVKGEAPLAPGAVVRFGDVQAVFEPSDEGVAAGAGGRTQVLKTPQSLAAPAPPPPPAAAPAPPAAPAAPAPPAAPVPPVRRPAVRRPAARAQQPPAKGKGCLGGLAALLLGGGALAVLLSRLLA